MDLHVSFVGLYVSFVGLYVSFLDYWGSFENVYTYNLPLRALVEIGGSLVDLYSQLQIGRHSILRLFLKTFKLVPGVPGFSWDVPSITWY